MLQVNPNNRLSAAMAADICQLLLWAPRTWKSEDLKIQSQEILQWLLTMTTKVLCESRFSNNGKALHEYTLVATFLSRFTLRNIQSALYWIQENQN